MLDVNKKYDIIYFACAIFSSAQSYISEVVKDCTIPEGGVKMASVIVKENESLDSALRRFKRNCAKAGIQQEIRKREHYEKPSVKRKKKSEAARKRKYN